MAKSKKEEAVETVEEVVETAKEATKNISEKVNEATDKAIGFFNPITEKVRDIVLGFGELIVTVSVIIGLITAILGGITDMGNLGFFTGLTNMFSAMISVVMGALVIFLLFAIYRKK